MTGLTYIHTYIRTYAHVQSINSQWFSIVERWAEVAVVACCRVMSGLAVHADARRRGGEALGWAFVKSADLLRIAACETTSWSGRWRVMLEIRSDSH